MVKAPRRGLVKTRLCPPLAAEDAAALAACFAQDTVATVRRVVKDYDVIIAHAPADGQAELKALLGNNLRWVEQAGANLGERLDKVMERAFSDGYGPLVVVGTDSPTLPESIIATAFRSLALEESDVVLGPTEDGGYYLIGLRRPAPGIFHDVAWSTPLAYQQTVRNAEQLGLRLGELQTWFDVDTFADLLRLRSEMASDEGKRLSHHAPATYRWLTARESLFAGPP